MGGQITFTLEVHGDAERNCEGPFVVIGMPDPQPHGLRRTSSQIGSAADSPITWPSVSLGHANVVRGQRQFNLKFDLERTSSDVIPIDGKGLES